MLSLMDADSVDVIKLTVAFTQEEWSKKKMAIERNSPKRERVLGTI